VRFDLLSRNESDSKKNLELNSDQAILGGLLMKKFQLTDQRMVFAVQKAKPGVAVEEVCRKLGVSQQTFYRWRKKFAGLVWI